MSMSRLSVPLLPLSAVGNVGISSNSARAILIDVFSVYNYVIKVCQKYVDTWQLTRNKGNHNTTGLSLKLIRDMWFSQQICHVVVEHTACCRAT